MTATVAFVQLLLKKTSFICIVVKPIQCNSSVFPLVMVSCCVKYFTFWVMLKNHYL